ncbi:hypothetical protein [Rhizobacter fulvus]
MDFIASALATRRARLTAAFTGVSLLLIVALLVNSGASQTSGLPPAKSFSLLLFPLAVYLLGRFGRTSVVAAGLALLWLAYGGWLSVQPYSPVEPWGGAYAIAVAFSGAGVLLKLRSAVYLWYLTSAALAVGVIGLLANALRDSGSQSTFLALVLALMLLTLAGFALVVMLHSRATRANPQPANRPLLTMAFGAALVSSAALVVWEWRANRIADTAGIEQVHESLRHLVRGGDFAPSCDRVTFCGDLVQFSCHQEVDGPVSFHNNRTGALVMECGGACMGGARPGTMQCGACPPPEWERCVSR